MVCLRNISVDTLHKGDTEDNNKPVTIGATGTISELSSSSSSSYICHGVGPIVDPFQSHISRSLVKGLP
jgi:hypothetical protein